MSENRTRFRLDQRRAPIYEALERFRQMRVVPFDVPGHKRGRGNPELTAFLGQQCVGVDVNSMKPLDNLCHPVSVIREAEELAADAFGAAHAFLMAVSYTHLDVYKRQVIDLDLLRILSRRNFQHRQGVLFHVNSPFHSARFRRSVPPASKPPRRNRKRHQPQKMRYR